MFQVEDDRAEQDIAVLVGADRLQLLYIQSYPAIFVSLFAAAVLLVALWPAQENSTLLGWFGLLLVTSTARLYLFQRYKKSAPTGEDVQRWAKPYYLTLMLTSAVWGFGALVIMPADSMLHQVIIYSYMIGLSGGAISLYSSHTGITLATITIILVPTTVYLLFNGGYVFISLAIGGVVFFLSAVRATRFIGNTLQQNFMMTHQLKISSKNAERLARTDDLTGLYNRRAFYEYGKLLANNCQRNKENISMIHMDIDNFKLINDTYGHVAGDDVLKTIGQLLQQRLRKSDVFARIGGEEFGLVLAMTSQDKAAQLAEELRQVIERTSFSSDGRHFNVTASFGVASDEYDIDTLVSQSDSVMYQSKESGRNRVICYQK
jgi:diguanylate cyclase (GGDEF)-like protein